MEIDTCNKVPNECIKVRAANNIYKILDKYYDFIYFQRKSSFKAKIRLKETTRMKLFECKRETPFRYIYEKYYPLLFTRCNYTNCTKEACYRNECCLQHQQDYVNEKCIDVDTYLIRDLTNIVFSYMTSY